MMNAGFREVLSAAEADRRDLFLATARRIGTTAQNVEKDFWVCWTLDALFNGLGRGGPRLLFKGGTSLSKAYGLIARFSEDIDITVFRDDIGQPAPAAALDAMTVRKRKAKLEQIRAACQTYINGPLLSDLRGLVGRALEEAGRLPEEARVLSDTEDPDGQSLIFWYPSVTTADAYVRPAVRIESGARSALDPNRPVNITPYIAQELVRIDLTVSGVTTIEPGRTFWDKVVILHGLRNWFERRGVLRQEGQRVSRHYYDVYALLQSDVGAAASRDLDMAVDCARHARLFFYRPDFDLDNAVPGRLRITPAPGMRDALRRDYENMAGMIFGRVPEFEAVIASIAEFEEAVNDAAR